MLTLDLLLKTLGSLHGTGFKPPSIPRTPLNHCYPLRLIQVSESVLANTTSIHPRQCLQKSCRPFQATYSPNFLHYTCHPSVHYFILSFTTHPLVPMHKSSSPRLLQNRLRAGRCLGDHVNGASNILPVCYNYSCVRINRSKFFYFICHKTR